MDFTDDEQVVLDEQWEQPTTEQQQEILEPILVYFQESQE